MHVEYFRSSETVEEIIQFQEVLWFVESFKCLKLFQGPLWNISENEYFYIKTKVFAVKSCKNFVNVYIFVWNSLQKYHI